MARKAIKKNISRKIFIFVQDNNLYIERTITSNQYNPFIIFCRGVFASFHFSLFFLIPFELKVINIIHKKTKKNEAIFRFRNTDRRQNGVFYRHLSFVHIFISEPILLRNNNKKTVEKTSNRIKKKSQSICMGSSGDLQCMQIFPAISGKASKNQWTTDEGDSNNWTT